MKLSETMSESPLARAEELRSPAKLQSYLGTFVDWASKAAPFLIAIPMAIFGTQHFIYLSFVANFIPAWIPWRVFWACFTGVALIAAAAGILMRLRDRLAATLLGTMIFLWVLLLHTSRIAAQPADFSEWRGIFQALAMSGCAFAWAGRSGTPGASNTKGLILLSELGAKLAPWFVGVAITALGVEHFIFSAVSTPQVPVWIPGTILGNCASGIVLILCGIGVCLPRSRPNSATILAIFVFLSMVLFHLPVVLRSPRFESDWTKTLVISGGAILLARVRGKTECEIWNDSVSFEVRCSTRERNSSRSNSNGA